ncbi:MAG: nicotinate-nucleotide adenylyltransferase [Rhodomicrobiaceae bacterium]
MTKLMQPNPPPAFSGMRIGLLGGSFNPAHDGHRHISVTALKRLALNRVWWLVTPGNPLKRFDELADLWERMAQGRKISAHPRIEVTDFEAGLSSPYSFDTLRFLKRRFPRVQFVWIIGGDNLAQFHRWRDWRRIFRTVPILVADRPDFRQAALASTAARHFAGAQLPESCAIRLPAMTPPAWTYLSLPLCDISSTQLRQGTVALKSR